VVGSAKDDVRPSTRALIERSEHLNLNDLFDRMTQAEAFKLIDAIATFRIKACGSRNSWW
jgi:hypothetical protein